MNGRFEVHVERDMVAGQAPPAALERRIDDVLRLDPFLPRLDLLAADAGGIEQVLDVVVEPLGLVAHDAGERGQPLVAWRSAGDLLSTVAAPRIEASGVRNSCETEPISASRSSSVSERIFASLSARATSSRSSVAAASDSTSSTRWRISSMVLGRHAAEIDGDDAEVGGLLRHAADEPDIAGAVVDGAWRA